MTEFYVTFEMAQMMKRLGFDKKVNHAYLKKISIEPELQVGILKEIHSKSAKNYNDNRKGADKGQMFYSAPRLDQAQTWLREDKGIFVGVTCDMSPTNSTPYGYEVKIPMCDDRISYGASEYNYALSAGIEKALELLGKGVQDV